MGKDKADEELGELVDRFRTLGSDPETWRSQLSALARDVRTWQARTGGTEIQVTTESVVVGSKSRDSSDGGGDDEDCPQCSGFTLSGDKICFLSSEGDCFDVGDDYVGRVCVYECISIGPGFGERDPGQSRGVEWS